ncbi:unnamed protein product, partial [Iphiclides podalirius]
MKLEKRITSNPLLSGLTLPLEPAVNKTIKDYITGTANKQTKRHATSTPLLCSIVTIYRRINGRCKKELGRRSAGGPRDDLDRPWRRLGWAGARLAHREMPRHFSAA